MSGSNDLNNKTPRLDEKPPLLMNRRFFIYPDSWCQNRKANTMKKSPAASLRIFADHRDHPLKKNHGALGWKEAA